MNILQGLNDRQIEAVTAIDGNIRVTAGAGSGKTRVLAHRYAFLVNEVGISPSNILCMTFTNKAAQEMKYRIGRMVVGGTVNDFVCTIHSFCVKFLREEIYRLGYPKNFPIIDMEDSKDLAKQVMEEFNLTKKMTVKMFLDRVHNSKIKSAYIKNYILPNSKVKKDTFFARYLELQQKSFALDFDDLIQFTLYIFRTYKGVKTSWQNKFYYIMVDEVQDCNDHDWKIIKNLTGNKHNLFIVGDPDQAIYEWRGAVPGNFINYIPDRDIILDENYRSTPNILDVANSVIKNNTHRIPKSLYTQKNNGKIAIHYHGKSEEDEGAWVAKQIESIAQKENAKFSDFAILYRASFVSRFIEQALLSKKIPYTIWGGIRFFERKEVKDALAYLRLATYHDDISLRRIINVPSRKFGKVSLVKLNHYAEKDGSNMYEALKKHVADFAFTMSDFVSLIEEAHNFCSSHSISDTLDLLLSKSGYKEKLRLDDDQERLDNLEELLNSVKYYEQANKNEPNLNIDTYLQDIALYTNADYNKDTPTVKLMTIHQAKGLEFPYVFVCGLTEGLFPSHRSIRERRDAALEEERRLMYVAITRAEKMLFLTESEGYSYATKSDKYPSRFLSEIAGNLIQVEGKIDPYLIEGTRKAVEDLDIELHPDKDLKFKKGDMVNHKYFGIGKILSCNKENRTYKVKFKSLTRDIDERLLMVITKEKINQQKEIDEQANRIPFLFVCSPLYESSFVNSLSVTQGLDIVQEQMESYKAEDFSFELNTIVFKNVEGQYIKYYLTRNYTGNKIFHIGCIIRIGEELFQILKLIEKSKNKSETRYKYLLSSFKGSTTIERVSTKFWKPIFTPEIGSYYEIVKVHKYLFLQNLTYKGIQTNFSFIDAEDLKERTIQLPELEELALSPCEEGTFLKNCSSKEKFKELKKKI